MELFKVAYVLMVAMLMVLALIALPVMADSGSGRSSGSSGDSGNSGGAGASGSDSGSGSNAGSSSNSGSNGEGSVSSSDSGSSGSSGNSVVADKDVNDKLKSDITVKGDTRKVDVNDGQNVLKAEIEDERLKVEAREGLNEFKADVRVKDSNSRQITGVSVKAEAKGGFAGVLSRLFASLFGRQQAQSEAVNKADDAPVQSVLSEDSSGIQSQSLQAQGKVSSPAPGIVIDKALSSGQGYPTGPLDISLPASQLLLDRIGQVREKPGEFEVRDRQYEAEFAAIPVLINGISYIATEVKVISSLKAKAGAAQHQGTIDIDIDVPLGSALPAGHITLEYKGSAVVSGALISSGGVFRTSKMTGVFAALVSEGTYSMTIIETGSALGSPATVSITTTSSV